MGVVSLISTMFDDVQMRGGMLADVYKIRLRSCIVNSGRAMIPL